MVEYVIEILLGDELVELLHVEKDGRFSRIPATPAGYAHARKFRVKARAEAYAAKCAHTTRVVGTYGGYVYGSKSTVAPIQSKVNKRPAYRSI